MISFYIKNLSIHRFWYLGAVLELIPVDTEDNCICFLVYYPSSSSLYKTQEGSNFALLTAESQFIEQCLALNEYVINT